jgi:uncharacterized RDD family membrane protein YckC
VGNLEGAFLMDLMSRPPLAGIGTRFAAILLDGLLPMLITIPAAIVGYIMYLGLAGTPPSLPSDTMQTVGIFVLLLTYLGFASYSALVLAMWAYGMTPGKYILGIRVVKVDTGVPVGFWRMALRQIIGQWAAAILCYLGFIWALFDANKQGWHDKIAKTLVVRTR